MHSAEIRDADGAELIFAKVKEVSEKLKKIWADMAYRGEKIAAVDSGEYGLGFGNREEAAAVGLVSARR